MMLCMEELGLDLTERRFNMGSESIGFEKDIMRERADGSDEQKQMLD